MKIYRKDKQVKFSEESKKVIERTISSSFIERRVQSLKYKIALLEAEISTLEESKEEVLKFEKEIEKEYEKEPDEYVEAKKEEPKKEIKKSSKKEK